MRRGGAAGGVILPRVAWWCVVCCVACGSRRRGDGRGGGVGLARSRAWGGGFGDVARAGSRVMRSMRASFGFGFGFGGSVRRGTAAAACHPKLASSCRRVAMSPLGGLGLGLARSRGGGGGGGGDASRARAMRRHPDGWADDGGAAVRCLARARVVREEDEREDKNEKTRGRRGDASAGGAELTSARA